VWPVTGGLERASAIFFAMGHNRFPCEAMCAVFEASAVVWHLPNSERTLWFEVYQRSIHLASEFRANPKRTRQNIRAIRRALGADYRGTRGSRSTGGLKKPIVIN
jgi:hypothetical protein